MQFKQTRCTRRQLILTLAKAGSLAALPLGGCSQAPGRREVIASAAGGKPEHFGLAWVNPVSHFGSEDIHQANTGFRGHDVIQHPLRPNHVLFIARRPGTEVLEIDTTNGQLVAQIRCQAGQHLNGHACFSADGQYLFTGESLISKGQGEIVVRDSTSYQIVGRFPSYGIEPHELKLLPDGNTLVVANGGILTHPESGRKKLNLDTMHSSLTYVDVNTGNLVDDFTLAEPKASIRHLDVAADGSVVFATQLQRDVMTSNQVIALGGYHTPDGRPQLFEQPTAVIARLNDYMGSVRVNQKSRLAGFTSPRGNLAVFWHLDSGEFAGYHSFHDVCGIACSTDDQHFVLSNSLGQLRRLNATSLKEDRQLRAEYPGTAWDNHLLITQAG